MGGLWEDSEIPDLVSPPPFSGAVHVSFKEGKKYPDLSQGAVLNQLLFAEDLPEATHSSEASVPVSPNKNGTGSFGGFLKWWVSPTGPWVFLLEMIKTWGVLGVPPLKETPIWDIFADLL